MAGPTKWRYARRAAATLAMSRGCGAIRFGASSGSTCPCVWRLYLATKDSGVWEISRGDLSPAALCGSKAIIATDWAAGGAGARCVLFFATANANSSRDSLAVTLRNRANDSLSRRRRCSAVSLSCTEPCFASLPCAGQDSSCMLAPVSPSKSPSSGQDARDSLAAPCTRSPEAAHRRDNNADDNCEGDDNSNITEPDNKSHWIKAESSRELTRRDCLPRLRPRADPRGSRNGDGDGDGDGDAGGNLTGTGTQFRMCVLPRMPTDILGARGASTSPATASLAATTRQIAPPAAQL